MTKRPNVSPMNILTAIADKNLFAPWFRDPASWVAWRSFLATLFGLDMSAEQLAIYKQCTGRSIAPSAPFTEAWLICGRRSGKSFTLALISVFLACFYDYRQHLAPGERGTVLVISADRKQSRVIMRYVRGFLTNIPMLKRMIEREGAEHFDLTNRISIEVATASFKTVRGYSVVAGLLDELAFWSVDSDAANPDADIIAAIRPGMATIPSAMLLCASSPYARRGALWDAHRKHHGRDDDPVLTWQAPTATMNPSVPAHVIADAYEADPASAAAEYGANFRVDVEALLSRETVEACIASGRHELEPTSGLRYTAFVDPSGGSADSMTLAIAHRDSVTKRVVLDAVRERRPPFSPDQVAKEFCDLLRTYRIHRVVGDRYGGEWPRERFRVHGIQYELSEQPKSDIYGALLPLLNAGRAELLDLPRLAAQLIGLERKTARSGRDSIDHCPGQHDDIANSCAGALLLADAHKPLVISADILAAAARPTRYSRSHPPRSHLMGTRPRVFL